jgi:hypothetical protein
MRSRALAVALTLLSLAAFTGAAFFVEISEQHVASIRNTVRAFDAATRDVAMKIAEFDAAGAGASLAALRSISTTDTARVAIDAAIAGVDDLSDTAPILARVADARLSEQEATDDAEAAQRRLESNALTAAAAFGIVVLATLTIAWPARHASSEPSSVESESPAPATAGLGLQSPSAYTTSRPAGPVLRKAAELCTNLGRVSDVDELRALVVRAADLIDASGLIVWMSVPGAKELRPVLSHGYSAEMIARLPPLSRTADNAAARGFRSGQLQIVLARPGSSNGAVVAPLLTSAGCVGVVSAEIRGGGESSESVQALAAIFAAQLAMVVPAPAVPQQSQDDRPATGTQGI